MQATISFTASIAASDGTKAISSSTVINSNFVNSGVVTVGNTYSEIVPSGTNAAVIVYNPASVDVSIRVTLSNQGTNEYACFNLVAGGIIVIPTLMRTDGLGPSEPGDSIFARTSSGTASLEYCLIN